MRLPHNEALCERYPITSNQHGDLHWPVLRVLVAHDLRTGLAMRPEWGAMHGPDAVSEQGLLEKAIDRLPDDYRTVMSLRYQDALPFNEIGRRLGRSADAVRMLWARAVDRLKQEIVSRE